MPILGFGAYQIPPERTEQAAGRAITVSMAGRAGKAGQLAAGADLRHGMGRTGAPDSTRSAPVAGRFGSPDEVAEAAAFLLGRQSGFIIGSTS